MLTNTRAANDPVAGGIGGRDDPPSLPKKSKFGKSAFASSERPRSAQNEERVASTAIDPPKREQYRLSRATEIHLIYIAMYARKLLGTRKS